jgi:hypothetical protein
MNVIFDPELASDCICKRIPIAVNCNCVFLVDMSELACPSDILCDDMGSWKWGGSYRVWLSLDEIGCVKVFGKVFPDKSDQPVYRIWKRYYVNKSSPDLKKLVVTIEGESMAELDVDRVGDNHVSTLAFLSDPTHEKLSERKAWENLSRDLRHRVERR